MGRNRSFLPIQCPEAGTLLSSFSSPPLFVASLFCNPSASVYPFLPLAPSACSEWSQVEKKSTMEALKASLRRETSHAGQQQSQGGLSEEACWVAERGNLVYEGFSVDDLLDLGEFVENEVEKEDDDTAMGEVVENEGGGWHDETQRSSLHSSPSSSSALTFELPPPPPPPPLSDICLPAHDAEELEWVSFIIDDSISEFPPPCSDVASVSPPSNSVDSKGQCQTRAAAIRGEAPTSCPTVCALSTEAMVPIKAKRSKRSRNTTVAWSMSGVLPFSDSPSSSTATTSSASSCSSTSSSSPFLIYDPSAGAVEQILLLCEHPPPLKKQKPKKRGRKPKFPSSATPSASGERRCSHCGVQKTPQWRAGPLGAKTLCNACGVRFKSGRLLPEYRPACSPTFVSQMHSNSHRKVLEMRRKKETELLVAPAAPPVASF